MVFGYRTDHRCVHGIAVDPGVLEGRPEGLEGQLLNGGVAATPEDTMSHPNDSDSSHSTAYMYWPPSILITSPVI